MKHERLLDIQFWIQVFRFEVWKMREEEKVRAEGF
jgi:hypothetical protein